MKKFTELKGNETNEVKKEEIQMVEKRKLSDKSLKEIGSDFIHNKWVRRIGTGVAVTAAAVAGFLIGSKKDEDDDIEIIDLDEESDDYYPDNEIDVSIVDEG